MLRVRYGQINLDIFWLKDAVTRVKERPGFQSLEDSANLPAPEVIAAGIVEDLQAALAQFSEIAADVAVRSNEPRHARGNVTDPR